MGAGSRRFWEWRLFEARGGAAEGHGQPLTRLERKLPNFGL